MKKLNRLGLERDYRLVSSKGGESAGIRTQDPRLKRAVESEEKQYVDIEKSSDE